MSDDGEVPRGENVYRYRPSLMGSPCEFQLGNDGLDWRAGRNSGHIPWRSLRRVRMSFRPASMQTYRFMTELWADGQPKLAIISTSWKSMFEQERFDRPYAAFITELHRRLAQAQSRAHFEQGTNSLQYWPGLAIFTGASLGLAALIVRALQAQVFAGVLFIAAFLALFLWRGGNYFRRNRPGLYRAETPPPDLLPK
jgi:hypothetical protein